MNVTFYTAAGGEQTIEIQDMDLSTDMVFFTQPQKSVGGKMHPRMRGQQRVFRIEYSYNVDPDTWRSIINNIVDDLTGSQTDITISEGSDLSNAVVVVPTDSFSYQLEYGRQIGSFVPFMEFTESTVASGSTGAYVDAGYVDSGYVS